METLEEKIERLQKQLLKMIKHIRSGRQTFETRQATKVEYYKLKAEWRRAKLELEKSKNKEET